MDVAAQAAFLYTLPLKEFTAARRAAAKDAAGRGEREVAAVLRTLPKPSSAAWLGNVLVARRRAEVEQVLELGKSLRQAQADGDRALLQALGQRRQTLLAGISRQATDAAAELGVDVAAAALASLEQTLRAALADSGAAVALLTGRLIRPLQASGWEPVDLEGAVAGPFGLPPGTDTGTGDAAAYTRRPGTPPGDAAARLSAAREALTAAEEATSDARQETLRASEQRGGVLVSITDLEERLKALRDRLAELDRDVADLSEQQAVAEEKMGRAAGKLRAAEKSVGPHPGGSTGRRM